MDGVSVQVFLTTLDLLHAALESIRGCKDVRHNQVAAPLEPIVVTLLSKLGDGQARLRDGAMNGLLKVARCRTAGPHLVRRGRHSGAREDCAYELDLSSSLALPFLSLPLDCSSMVCMENDSSLLEQSKASHNAISRSRYADDASSAWRVRVRARTRARARSSP